MADKRFHAKMLEYQKEREEKVKQKREKEDQKRRKEREKSSQLSSVVGDRWATPPSPPNSRLTDRPNFRLVARKKNISHQ